MQPTIVGLFVGLLLGLALAFDGFGSMLIVAFCGAVGYVVMKVVQGEIDLTPYLGGGGKIRRWARRRWRRPSCPDPRSSPIEA
jgi:hypothetical protein